MSPKGHDFGTLLLIFLIHIRFFVFMLVLVFSCIVLLLAIVVVFLVSRRWYPVPRRGCIDPSAWSDSGAHTGLIQCPCQLIWVSSCPLASLPPNKGVSVLKTVEDHTPSGNNLPISRLMIMSQSPLIAVELLLAENFQFPFLKGNWYSRFTFYWWRLVKSGENDGQGCVLIINIR